MTPLIRPMRPSDIAQIVALDRLILGQSLGESTFESELTENQFNHYFVMEDKQAQIIGHIGLWIDPPLAQILNFYIVEDVRRTGLGRHLLTFAIWHLAMQGVDTITLEVRQTNHVAIRLYESFGFFKAAVRKQYYADGQDADLMLKNL
jgi:[ribosomal protein S18]-alanine N-acetyltransferase